MSWLNERLTQSNPAAYQRVFWISNMIKRRSKKRSHQVQESYWPLCVNTLCGQRRRQRRASITASEPICLRVSCTLFAGREIYHIHFGAGGWERGSLPHSEFTQIIQHRLLSAPWCP